MNASSQSKIEELDSDELVMGAPENMESEIEFGQLEHSQPATGLRPDQDKHFVVAMCGEIADGDLPIFVDMDVMRDMEAHARENTRVELGGVMLGRQHLDTEGNPFVIITDSLRAKHYEATKGSFKFTHETWSQITRERNEFKGDLELVGWYHTHPGWGVFLSGMDLFICNNFFSRPLDVALVIDPCAGDRGWFQWSTEQQTRQTPGFFLMTNRHRKNELNYFAEIFSSQNPQINDPRFRQASFGESGIQQGESMVNVIDNRRPVFELAIVSMLFLQVLVVAVFGFKLLGDSDTEESAEMDSRLAAVEARIEGDSVQREASLREQAYQNILSQIVDGQSGTPGLVEKYTDIATENQLLSENLEGQLARVKLAQNQNSELSYRLKSEQQKSQKLEDELRVAQSSIQEMQNSNQELVSEDGLDSDSSTLAQLFPAWLIYTVGGIVLFFLGIIGGSWFSRRQSENDREFYEEFENDRDSSSSSSRETNQGKSIESKQPIG